MGTSMPETATPTCFSCGICGTTTNQPGSCTQCQKKLDDTAATEQAGQTRALAGTPIAEAVHTYLATLSAADLLVAEHRAQIRIANAGQGVMRIQRLVNLGTLPHASLEAARDELEAARMFCRLVHNAEQAEVQRQWAAGCGECDPDCYGPPCADHTVDADAEFTRTVDV